MKNRILQTLLIILVIFSASCSAPDTSIQKNERTKATAITFISPQGIETRLFLDDGDGQITSGNKGKNTYEEVREIFLEVTGTSYIIHTEGKLYYLPLDYALEVSTN